MKTYKQIVREYSRYLKEVTHIPQKEVEILILHLVQQNTIWLHLNYDKECSCEKELEKLVKKRATNYPLEYITKRASFYGEVFNVRDGVLIPRPETEILVENAETILKEIKAPKVLEIGVGSGIISVMLAILIPDIEIIAVDINDKALELAKSNAKKHNVEDKITFIKSDLFTNVPDIQFDMVVSNPPYIADDYKLPSNVKYEPSNALFGGNIGDELLKDIILQTKQKEIKYLLCEMGYDQKTPLTNFVKENISSYKSLEFYKDYDKFDRGFTLVFK
ncbi:peptide chain release factor N(5)-glutamine methyltransferase [Arcobacter sp. 15-2]|uniref:peptide chain release factor N(5)-glutamine methyltransferase n=1 Tax=Arcobacter sp. 15-2 TaxID=3374109 RepID=UPI00399D07A0